MAVFFMSLSIYSSEGGRTLYFSGDYVGTENSTEFVFFFKTFIYEDL